MPIYEFVCEACGRLVEVMQKVTDPPPAPCPECGAGRLARTVSRTSFQLKGGGWYSDLYASTTKAVPGGGEPKPAATAESAPAGASAPAPAAGGGASAPGPTSGSGSGSGTGGGAAT